MVVNMNLRLGKYARFLKIICFLGAARFIASILFSRTIFVKQGLQVKEQVLINNHSNMTDIGKWVIPNRNIYELERCELHWDCSPGKPKHLFSYSSQIIYEKLWVLIDNNQ